MTPEQRLIAKWTFIILFLVGVFFTGFGVRGYMAEHADLEDEVTLQSRENQALAQYAFDLKTLTTQVIDLQTQAGALEQTHLAEREKMLDENNRLRGDVAVAERMRLKGTTCPKASAPSAGASASEVGDGAEVGLSTETRYFVFDTRESITKDVAALNYLQGYLTEFPYCSKVPIGPLLQQ